MLFMAELENMQTKFWLKGSTWTSDQDSADIFETEEECRKKLEYAQKFMLKRLAKVAKVITV